MVINELIKSNETSLSFMKCMVKTKYIFESGGGTHL